MRAAVVFAGAAVIAGLLIGGARAVAAERPSEPASAPMQVLGVGPTVEEMLALKKDLHESLMNQIPTGLLDHAISVPISPKDAQVLRDAMEAKSDPYLVGVVKSVQHPISFESLAGHGLSRLSTPVGGGLFRATIDGGFVWMAAFKSDGAMAIRIHFDKVDLPKDAALYILNKAADAFGPYSGRGPTGTGEFWSDTVAGDTAVVVLRHNGPSGALDLRRSSITVADLGHLGPAFRTSPAALTESFCSFNASCIENASCHNGTPADPAKSAVALMQWISGAFIYTCTGGLITDTPFTGTPYFLTANHCISSNSNASNLQTYFQFTLPCGSTNCPAQTNPGGIQLLGATVKATGTTGDYTLLQLNQTPPAGSVWLGWNNTPIANTNNAALYRISHPAWAPQSYWAGSVDTSAPTCTGWPRGERIYSRTTAGGTEGGSSGSPVVNASSQIVGQLSGACGTNVNNACDNVNNATVDGAFAIYYSNVQTFLNPGGGGGCGASGTSCTSNAQCCSNKCTGAKNRKTCR